MSDWNDFESKGRNIPRENEKKIIQAELIAATNH